MIYYRSCMVKIDLEKKAKIEAKSTSAGKTGAKEKRSKADNDRRTVLLKQEEAVRTRIADEARRSRRGRQGQQHGH